MPVPLRLLLRAPGTAAIAILSIALSVGATTIVFAAIRAVLLEPLAWTCGTGSTWIRVVMPPLRERRSDPDAGTLFLSQIHPQVQSRSLTPCTTRSP